jgi:two-component system, OmpR family, response regulator VanR
VRILIAEDEPLLARTLATGLRQQAMAVDVAADGAAALERLAVTAYDVLILDRDLPVVHGDEVCRRLVAEGAPCRILMLTAARALDDTVTGFGLGADDYLTKPFGLRELMSRIKALLRRAYGDLSDAAGGRVIRHGDLVIDLERRRVQRGQRRISLTPTEFEILRHLASRPGRVYTRSELLELLRDYEALDQDEKTINVHVSHLRDKIEDDPAVPAFVLTVRGVGYAFAER